MKKILLLLFFIGFTISLVAQNVKKKLTKELSVIHENSDLPGFSVSIVNKDSILYKESFGYENIKSKKPFSTNQRFYIASISKTFIGLTIMQLVEEGLLELSTPINDILPFRVINPYYPNDEITIEHLARHTSSILYQKLEQKSWYLENNFSLKKKEVGKTAFKDFCNWEKNEKSDLGMFLDNCLSPEGKLYSKNRFSKSKPGTSYEYSNLGAALAAYIIEVKTATSYDEYIEKFVAKEFGFQQGIWRHHSAADLLPTSYFQTKVETPIHKPILYPTGGMMLSCEELTEYMIEMINGFNGNGNILQPKSFQQMMSSNGDAKNGVFWELNEEKIGHNGGNYGVTCFMNFDKTTGIGKIFITNISSYQNDDLLKEMIFIWRKMDEYTFH